MKTGVAWPPAGEVKTARVAGPPVKDARPVAVYSSLESARFTSRWGRARAPVARRPDAAAIESFILSD